MSEPEAPSDPSSEVDPADAAANLKAKIRERLATEQRPRRVAAPPVTQRTEVIVVDIEMPFGSMVRFMVKWAIAAIPALIILAILGVWAMAVFAAIGSALK